MTNEDLKIAIESMVGEIQQKVGEIRNAVSEFDDKVREAERTGYVGDLYRSSFTVQGKGAFPIDMLRYANCWPADETDAHIIERSLDEDVNYKDLFTLRLTKYHRDIRPNLCEERWESKFRWKVIGEVETTRL